MNVVLRFFLCCSNSTGSSDDVSVTYNAIEYRLSLLCLPTTNKFHKITMASSPVRKADGSLGAVGALSTVRSSFNSGPPNVPGLTVGSAPDPVALLNMLQATARNQRSSSSGNYDSSAASFHPIDILNQHYASEVMLASQLPALRTAVTERIEKLDDHISNALQRQSETAASTRRHVQEAKASVQTLQQRILQVKEKASLSEVAVLDITKDMKKLDAAKQHLQRTITTLKRLHMLVNAVEQLRLCCSHVPFPDFRTASQLVDATRLLMTHFDAYTQKVEPMRLLSSKVRDFSTLLKETLIRGFRIVGLGLTKTRQMEGTSSPEHATRLTAMEDEDDWIEEERQTPIMTVDVMQGCVLFMDALGVQERANFITDFCQDQLSDYSKEFDPPFKEMQQGQKRVSSFKVKEIDEEKKAQSMLDAVEKRFIWFREVVKNVERKFPKVFPGHWNLQATLAKTFLQLVCILYLCFLRETCGEQKCSNSLSFYCIQTREHFLLLLDGPRKDPDANNASILLKALQKTIIFEMDITAFLHREYATVFAENSVALDDSQISKEGKEENTLFPPLLGTASSAYENYMQPYIQLEEQTISEQLGQALEDRSVDTRGERPVFISSTNLFVYVKGSISRCTALTKGNAFFLLYKAFKDSLRKYAQILDRKLPPPINAQNATGIGGIAIAGSFATKQDNATVAHYRLPAGEEVTVCQVISTCEYCADTVEALEELIRDTIEERFKPKIDMMGDQEHFHDITAKAIRVLVSGLSRRVEEGLKPMSTTDWAMAEVGDESQYVRTIHEEIEPFVIAVKKLLPTSYFRSFCDKFAASFIAIFFECITRLRKISESGSQQLLLDASNLKTLVLRLPVLEEAPLHGLSGKNALPTGSTIAPAMYTKMINYHFGKLETILKLVGTPNELLVDNFKVQWPDGAAEDLTLVLSLKGFKRTEQVSMLEKFGMDPSAALKGATAGVTSASIVTERLEGLQAQGSTVAAKVNSDLFQMRQKVDVFRRTFRTNSDTA
jgi:hypothetical protein